MLRIIGNNLKQFIVSYRLIFVLFMMSQVVSTLAVMYLYGNISFLQKESIEYNESIRTFTINPVSKFDSSLDKHLTDITKEKKDLIRHITVELDGPVRAFFTYPRTNSVSFGRFFNENDFNLGKKQIIIGDNLVEGSKKVGDIFALDDQHYEIIGIYFFGSYHEIPYKSIENTESITAVSLVLEEAPDQKQVVDWLEYLHSKFPNAIISEPELPDLEDSARNLYEQISYIAIGLIAVLNFSYLYRYILLRRKDQYATLRICGCSNIKGTAIYLIEVLVLSTAQFIFSGIVFHSLASPLFTVINENLKYVLGIGDYLTLYVIYTGVILLIFTPTIAGYSRQMPAALRKDFL